MSERKRRKKINGEYGIDIVFTGGEKKCDFFSDVSYACSEGDGAMGPDGY